MTEAVIVDKKPVVLTLEPGTYYWCPCGRSSNQPFCDGSHKGTDFKPMKLEITESKKVVLCLCKYTKNPPFCDRTHTQL